MARTAAQHHFVARTQKIGDSAPGGFGQARHFTAAQFLGLGFDQFVVRRGASLLSAVGSGGGSRSTIAVLHGVYVIAIQLICNRTSWHNIDE